MSGRSAVRAANARVPGRALALLLCACALAVAAPMRAVAADSAAAEPQAQRMPPPDAEARIDPASGHGAPLPPPPGLPAPVPTRAEVVLVVGLDPAGEVVEVAIERSSRIRQYDLAAIAYARTLHYQPQVLNGIRIASRLRVLVAFAADAHAPSGTGASATP